jgi:hypothetical protein
LFQAHHDRTTLTDKAACTQFIVPTVFLNNFNSLEALKPFKKNLSPKCYIEVNLLQPFTEEKSQVP